MFPCRIKIKYFRPVHIVKYSVNKSWYQKVQAQFQVCGAFRISFDGKISLNHLAVYQLALISHFKKECS